MFFRVYFFLLFATKMVWNVPKVYHKYTRVISCVTAQDLGPLGQKNEAKTASEQLQNISQGLLYPLVCAQNGLKWHLMTPKSTNSKLGSYCVGLLFPLVCNQNGLKWPQSSPKVYHQYNRVISSVTTQDLGPMGLKYEAKKDSEQLQNVSQGSTLCPKWPQMAPYGPQSLPIAN